MKTLHEFISESFDNIKDMGLTYKEFCRNMRGNVWGDSGKYSRTMPGLYQNTLHEWVGEVENLAELMSPDAAEIFLNTINSSHFKKNHEKLVFYVSKKSDGWKMRDIGVASRLRDKNIPLAFNRDGSYPCFYAFRADDFAYWFKDNLKNCIKYIEKNCIE